MNDEAVRVMFESLSHIMSNQQKIMRNMGIKKYVWDNIKHEILFNNGIESNELRIESYYIKLYKSDNPEYGYNYPHLQQKEKMKKCKCIELDKEFESLSSASNFLFVHKYSGSLISTSCKNNTEVCGYHFVFI